MVERLLSNVIYGARNSEANPPVFVEDVLRIQPHRYIDYSRIARIGDMLTAGGVVTVKGELIEVRQHFGPRPRVTARLHDGSGALTLTWFSTFIAKQITEGDIIYASGAIRRGHGGGLEMTSPEWEFANRPNLSTGRITPVYPLTKGLSEKQMRTITRNALDATRAHLVDWLADAKDYLPPDLALVPLDVTYEHLHYPDNLAQVAGAKRRLQFENLLLLQIGMIERKRRVKASEGRAFTVDQSMLEQYVAALPFTLTVDQAKAIETIATDLTKPTPMTQLLQGDVGSGKTAVAAAIALIARANHTQTARLVAP